MKSLKAGRRWQIPKNFFIFILVGILMDNCLTGNAQPQAKRGNFMANSSFELGFNNWGDQWDDKTFYLDNTTAFDGQHSLKLVAPYKKYPYYNLINTSYYNFASTIVFSGLFKLEPNKPYTLSLYMKSELPEQAVSVGLLDANFRRHGQPFKVNNTWKRYSIFIPSLESSNYNAYQVDIRCDFGTEKDNAIWIDAVQLEEGETTDYSPAQGIELGMWSQRPSNIFHAGKPIVFNVGVSNNARENKKISIDYKIVNFYKQVVKDGSLSLETSTKDYVVFKELTLELEGVGYFKGIFEIAAEGIKKEISFGVITPQDCKDIPDSSPFGNFCMPKRKFGWEMCNEIGMKWYRGGEGTYGDIVAAKEWGSIAGASSLYFPGWQGGGKLKSEEIRKIFLENEAAYKKKIYELFTRAKGELFYYEVWNEPFYEIDVDNYLLIQKAAYEAVKSADLKIPVLANLIRDWGYMKYLEEFLAKGGWKYCDGITSHPYREPFNLGPEESAIQEEFREINRLILKYAGKKMPVWITEFNWMAVDDFKPEEYPYTAEYSKYIIPEDQGTAWMVRAHVYALAEGVERFQWHYFAPENMEWVSTHWNMVRRGSTPRPMYVAYGVMSGILARAKIQKEINIGSNLHAFLFKEKEKNIIVFWHSLKDFQKKGEIELAASPEDIETIDIMGNKIKATVKEGRMCLPLTAYPCYLVSAIPEGVLTEDMEKAYINGLEPVLSGRWVIQNIKEPKVVVENRSNRKIMGRVRLISHPGDWNFEESQIKFPGLLPRSSQDMAFHVTNYHLSQGKEYVLEASVGQPAVTEGEVKRYIFRGTIVSKLISTQRTLDISIDGDLKDWVKIKPAVFDKREDIWSVKTGQNNSSEWNGPQDLSAKIYSVWDNEYLYLALEVTDDVFVEHHGDPIHSYLADGLQMVFDVLNDASSQAKGRPDKYDFIYTAAQVGGKPELWRCSIDQVYEKQHRDEMGKLAIKRTEKDTVYEIAIPMKDLSPFVPAEGGVIGFNLNINDNDGQGRRGWLALSGGIGEGLDPSLYGHLVLITAENQ